MRVHIEVTEACNLSRLTRSSVLGLLLDGSSSELWVCMYVVWWWWWHMCACVLSVTICEYVHIWHI